jgi:hypothetical protein
MEVVGISRFLVVLGCAVVVLGFGLAALFGAFGGGGHGPYAAPTTTSTSQVTVGLDGPNTRSIRIAVPNVVGETQEQATETLAAIGLGTSATNEYVTGGRNDTVVSQAPWPGSRVVPGSMVSIRVLGTDQ